jgi:hypothetical protein
MSRTFMQLIVWITNTFLIQVSITLVKYVDHMDHMGQYNCNNNSDYESNKDKSDYSLIADTCYRDEWVSIV